MALRQLFLDIAREYPGYLSLVKVSGEHPAYTLVVKDVPAELERLNPPRPQLLYKGSTGAGNITPAPWVATLDRRETDQPTRGYYVVYLFSTELSRVFLSLALGVTEFQKNYGTGVTYYEALSDAASKLAARIADGTLQGGRIDLGAQTKHKLHQGYEYSNIAAIEYQLASLPDDAVLEADYRRMLGIYESLVVGASTPAVEDLAADLLEAPHPQTIELIDFQPRPVSRKSRSSWKRGRRHKEPKTVGDHAERLVKAWEEERLREAGRPDLGDKVDWPAARAEYPGWDISSFEIDGTPRRIEVKGSTGKIDALHLTANEWEAARRYREEYFLYLVHYTFKETAKLELVRDPAGLVEKGSIACRPSAYIIELTTDQ